MPSESASTSGATSNRDATGRRPHIPRDRRHCRKRPPIYGRAGSRAHLLFPIQTDAVGSALGDRAHDAAGGDDRARHPPRCRRAGSAGAGARGQDDDRHVCARHGGAAISDDADEQLCRDRPAADGNRLVRVCSPTPYPGARGKSACAWPWGPAAAASCR